MDAARIGEDMNKSEATAHHMVHSSRSHRASMNIHDQNGFGLVLFNLRLRWLGRQLHMAASFYSHHHLHHHHHHGAGRRPIRAAKKPGGMGSLCSTSASNATSTHPFPINCHRLSAYGKLRLVGKMYDQLAAGSNACYEFYSKLQACNFNCNSISISLPSCIIHGRARCRC
ncbi:uncharacterized protein LOC120453560 [Drosophila santomea]|uniref:uncharacterized protein LOC120453560 n=1 Tax=Drosophila santomea TaxID=129105 RepID=UPI001954C337|nr:uncharacterized protein LOC120453560 [Drosophila santomea]